MTPKRVLIFTASYGDGHQQVGRALLDALGRRGIEAIACDSFRETNQFTAGFSEWSFELSSKYFPWLYGVSYRLTANLPPSNPLWQMFALMSRKAALRAIDEFRPDAVLQLFPDHALSTLTRSHNRRPFIGVVLTDYSVHSRWFHRAVDTYYLPSPALMEDAERLAGSEARLIPSGIPVRPEFTNAKSAERPVQERYVLFSTGGRGVFPDLKTTIQLTRSTIPDFPIYVMCGRNEKMYATVQSYQRTDPSIMPLGFQSNMAEWLCNAEFAVMKSGGVTVTEALVSRCPMLLYKPISGQESDNAQFVERVGAGKIARNPDEFGLALQYFSNIHHRQSAKEVCRFAVNHAAADKMVDDLLEQLG